MARDAMRASTPRGHEWDTRTGQPAQAVELTPGVDDERRHAGVRSGAAVAMATAIDAVCATDGRAALIRVLLVGERAAFRQALALALAREPDLAVVGQVGAPAVAQELPHDVDVTLVALRLPGPEGLGLVREIAAAGPTSRVLVLAASADREDLAGALAAGAAGVLPLTAGLREIIAAARCLGAGEDLLTPPDTPPEMLALRRQVGRERAQERAARLVLHRLTPRERVVLQALAEGLSDKEIAQRLWVSPETVRTHMVHILGKLGVQSRLQALVVAVRHGLVTIR